MMNVRRNNNLVGKADSEGMVCPSVGARRLPSHLPVWTTQDPCLEKYFETSPYAYCAGNPIRFTDPTGCISMIVGDRANEFVQELQKKCKDLELSLDENGNLAAKRIIDSNKKLSKESKKILEGIESTDHILVIEATSSKTNKNGGVIFGGSQMGAVVNKDDNGKLVATAYQLVNVDFISNLSEAYDKPGQDATHEYTECYNAASIALSNKEDVPVATIDDVNFKKAHNKAVKQSGGFRIIMYDVSGKETKNPNNANRFKVYPKSGKNKDKLLMEFP